MHHPPVTGASGLPARRRARSAAAAWALTVLSLGAVASSAVAADAPRPARSDSVLVKIDPGASPAETAGVGRALDAESARTLIAGWRAYELPAPVTVAQARGLLTDADAAGAVQLDAPVHALEVPDDPGYAGQWPLDILRASEGWDIATPAAPVTVAVIDTGVDTSHPDLAGRLWTNPGEIAGNNIDDDLDGYIDDVHGWNFHDWTNQIYSPTDGDSHGTHVAGVIGAQRGNGVGVAGLADNARIMVLKFLKPGGGQTSDAIVAIQYAMAEGATVINASWGGTGYSSALCDAIAQAGAAGVVFVAAAGNTGTNNDDAPLWPANCPASSLISVAATTDVDGLADFSNRGATQVDVGAPGESVLSTIPGASYGLKSGTSMAAPQVSGIAAAVMGAHPGMLPWQTRAAIMTGGDPAPALVGTTASGRRVSLLGALQAAAAGIGPDTRPPDPFATLSPGQGLVTTSTLPTFRWAPASDAQSGVAGYRLTLDAVTLADVPASTTQAIPASPLAEGVHHWSVSAVDSVGNRRSTDPRTLLVDRTAPSVPAPSSPSGGAVLRGPAVTLVWTPSTDAVSGVAGYRVIVDGVAAATAPAAGHSATVRLTPGRHLWQVVATDAAGNESVSVPRGVSVSTAAVAPVRQRLTLSIPARFASGKRPLLRLALTRSARVTVAVRRSSSPEPFARFSRRFRAGGTDLALPPAFSRPMRRAGTYVVLARAPGGLRDSIRIRVR